MRRTLFALVAVLALAGAACSSDSSTPSGNGACTADAATASDSVTIAGFAFDPNCFTVSAGATISLSNEDDVTHSFTLDDSSADVSVDVDGGGSGEATAPNAGTYPFHCRFHSQMTGTLIVT
ncbi:MAG TPA: cupredoxin domain-containing protein [Actinomycetota bacterium]|jgi:plastocyanin|nr:cupredoxin domain-containing protein [Actinomycetota bacterium]